MQICMFSVVCVYIFCKSPWMAFLCVKLGFQQFLCQFNALLFLFYNLILHGKKKKNRESAKSVIESLKVGLHHCSIAMSKWLLKADCGHFNVFLRRLAFVFVLPMLQHGVSYWPLSIQSYMWVQCSKGSAGGNVCTSKPFRKERRHDVSQLWVSPHVC